MIEPALEAVDLTAVLATLSDQERHGHTAASDRELGLGHFAGELVRRAQETADIARPGDRQNLDVAYRRAARLGAFAIATMRRIRAEQRSGQ